MEYVKTYLEHTLCFHPHIGPTKINFKIAKNKNKSTTSTQDFIHDTCLARYLRPQFIVFDNGLQGLIQT
jgi:hypothetical protein